MQQIAAHFGITLRARYHTNHHRVSPHPTDREKLQRILTQLGFAPRDLMRKKEAVYAEFELNNPSLSDGDLIDFMVKHPILI